MKMKSEKRELEAIHQLSKNMYGCIGDSDNMITKYDQLEIESDQLKI
jgi:hypothetical protein